MIDCIFFIEAQGNDRGHVEKSLRDLLDEMKKNTNVVDSTIEDIVEEDIDGNVTFSGVLEAEIRVPFRDFINLCMRLTPTAVEMVDGDVKLAPKELLEVLGDVSALIQKLTDKLRIQMQLTEMKRTQEEIGLDEEFIEEMLEDGGISVRFVTEVAGTDEEKIKSSVISAINSTNGYVHKMNSKKMEEGKMLVGSEILFESIEDLFDAATRFIPVAITIEHPEEILITMVEVRDIGLELSKTVTLLTHQQFMKK